MAAENIRKEFSLDHYDSLLVNYGMGKANAYRMLFVNQRRLNKLETELGLAPNSRYSVKKYNSILNEKGLAEADLYREFYQIKNQMVKDLHLLNMGTEEEYDDNVDLDPTSTKVDENGTTDPTVNPTDPTDTVENPTDTQETETSTVVENPQTTTPVEDTVEDTVEEEHPDIEGLRQKYLEVVGKPVANIMKNNAEWIKAKIEEAENAKTEDTKAEENNTDTVETTDPTDPVENNTTEANPSVNDEAKTE